MKFAAPISAYNLLESPKKSLEKIESQELVDSVSVEPLGSQVVRQQLVTTPKG